MKKLLLSLFLVGVLILNLISIKKIVGAGAITQDDLLPFLLNVVIFGIFGMALFKLLSGKSS